MIEDVFFKPPAYGRVVNWLGPQMAARLLEFTQSHQNNFRETGIWNVKGEAEINLNTRRSRKANLLAELRDEFETRARKMVPEICRQLGSTRFEPSRVELEIVAHGDGAFYAEHCDTDIQSQYGTRLISAVYYFHRIPKSFSGGALRIYPIAGSAKSKAFVEIEPINDTLIFFPSWFPHEVMRVACPSGRLEDSRFAINCWFHR